jgi:hypothetical protein
MGNSFGLGGLGWLFVPAPLAKPALVAHSAQVTLGSAKNLGSAKTPWEKISGFFQVGHNASFLKRRLFGYKSKKPNNISLPGTGRGKAIISMSDEEKKTKKEAERQLAKNILSGKFANKLRNQKTSPPPIKPEGEFAEVPFFNQKMKKFRINGLTRENFIDLFIEKIIEYSESRNYNQDETAMEELFEFRKQISTMTFPQIRNLTQNLFKLEEEIKSKQWTLNLNKKNNSLKNDPYGMIKNQQDEIDKLIENKNKGLELMKGFDNFFLNFQDKPKNKNNAKSRKKQCESKFNLGDTKFFEINLFLSRNYYNFYKKITEKIKEIEKKIIEIRENSVSANEKYMIKIHGIIRDHENFFNVLSFLFDQIKRNPDEKKREAGIQKLIKMKIIIDKILTKNKDGYLYKLAVHKNKTLKNSMDSFGFEEIIKKYYQKIKNDEIAKRTLKREKNSRETFYGGIKFADITTEVAKEIDENLDITGLLTALNKLIEELYKEYNLNKDPQIPIPQMKNKVPPITLHKSLNYEKLIDMIYSLFNKKRTPDEYIKILKLKLYVDELMKRFGGSNYEKFKVEYDSRILDKKFKRNIPDFDTKVIELKAEISKKSNEELKTEANKLLDEFKSYIDKFNNNLNKIGNITGLTKPVNAANTVTQAPINSKNNKLPNAVNSTNAASVASTRNGNGNDSGNQSVIMNSELPPFKNNLRQQSQLQLQQQNVR